MAHHHGYSIRSALYRVFVQPTLTQKNRAAACPTFLLPQRRHQTTENSGPGPALSKYQQKLLRKQQEAAQQPQQPPRRGPAHRPQARPRRPPLPPIHLRAYQVPYDQEIRSRWIALVDRNGQFHPRVPLNDVLRSLDSSSEHLVQITRPDDVGDDGIPNCKIYSKAQLRDIQKRKEESEKERKKAEKSGKEIEFSWQMAPNDFEMRLRQFAGFLAEGRKVEVTVISKRRGREVEIDECLGFLDKIRGAAVEVGAKELGEQDGVLGKRILLKFQGHAAKK